MQVEYFDLPLIDEPQKVELQWPLKFVAFKFRGETVRVYFVTMPRATEQIGTFYLITSEQVVPETFPGMYLATVHSDDSAIDDDAFHLFFETPVNRPAHKPRILDNEGSSNGAN